MSGTVNTGTQVFVSKSTFVFLENLISKRGDTGSEDVSILKKLVTVFGRINPVFFGWDQLQWGRTRHLGRSYQIWMGSLTLCRDITEISVGEDMVGYLLGGLRDVWVGSVFLISFFWNSAKGIFLEGVVTRDHNSTIALRSGGPISFLELLLAPSYSSSRNLLLGIFPCFNSFFIIICFIFLFYLLFILINPSLSFYFILPLLLTFRSAAV